MTTHQMELLLASVKHYMPQDLRAKVMREVPEAYNAWVGHDVVEIVRVSDGAKVRQP